MRFLTRFGRDFWRSWDEAGPKMGPRWTKLAASAKVAARTKLAARWPKVDQDGPR